jgi:hypothetical protein
MRLIKPPSIKQTRRHRTLSIISSALHAEWARRHAGGLPSALWNNHNHGHGPAPTLEPAPAPPAGALEPPFVAVGDDEGVIVCIDGSASPEGGRPGAVAPAHPIDGPAARGPQRRPPVRASQSIFPPLSVHAAAARPPLPPPPPSALSLLDEWTTQLIGEPVAAAAAGSGAVPSALAAGVAGGAGIGTGAGWPAQRRWPWQAAAGPPQAGAAGGGAAGAAMLGRQPAAAPTAAAGSDVVTVVVEVSGEGLQFARFVGAKLWPKGLPAAPDPSAAALAPMLRAASAAAPAGAGPAAAAVDVAAARQQQPPQQGQQQQPARGAGGPAQVLPTRVVHAEHTALLPPWTGGPGVGPGAGGPGGGSAAGHWLPSSLRGPAQAVSGGRDYFYLFYIISPTSAPRPPLPRCGARHRR